MDSTVEEKRKEQEKYVRSRKRKLRELFAVTRHIEVKPPPPSPTAGDWPPNAPIGEAENVFLELNDIQLGRLFDEGTYERARNFFATSGKNIQSPLRLTPHNGAVLLPAHANGLPTHRTSPPQSPVSRLPLQKVPFNIVSPSGVDAELGIATGEARADVKDACTQAPRVPSRSPTRAMPTVSPERRKPLPHSPLAEPSLVLQEDSSSKEQLVEELHKSGGIEASDKDQDKPLKKDLSVQIASVEGIPVIHSATARSPVAAAFKDNSISGISVGLHPSVSPPVPPSPAISRSQGQETARLSEDRTNESLEEPPQTITNAQTPPRTVSSPLESHRTPSKQKSPTSSQPQLQLVPPSTPIKSYEQQYTPSSPISSVEDDDDRDARENDAIISSATSPDVGGMLPDVPPGTAEVMEEEGNLKRIVGDPNAQLKLEEELASQKETIRQEQVMPVQQQEPELPSSIVMLREHPEKSTEESVVNPIEQSDGTSDSVENRTSEEVVKTVTPNAEALLVAADKAQVSETMQLTPALPFVDHSVIAPTEQAECQDQKINDAPTLVGTKGFVIDSTGTAIPRGIAETPAIPPPAHVSASSLVKTSESPPSEGNLPEAVQVVNKMPEELSAATQGTLEDIPMPDSQPESTNQPDVEEKRLKDIGNEDNSAMDVDEQVEVEAEAAESLASSRQPSILHAELITDEAGPPSAKPAVEESSKLKLNSAFLAILEEQKEREKQQARLASVIFLGPGPSPTRDKKITMSHPKESQQLPQQNVPIPFPYCSTRRASASQHRRTSSTIIVSQSQPYAPQKQKDYLTPLFQLDAFDTPTRELIGKSHKTLLTSNHQTCIQEEQMKKVLRRIQQLQIEQKWSLRQPVRVKEPKKTPCHWDYLLDEMKWMSTDFRQERRWKVALAKEMMHCVMEWHTAGPAGRSLLCVRARRPERQEAGKSEDMSREISEDPNVNACNDNDADIGMDVDEVHTPPVIIDKSVAILDDAADDLPQNYDLENTMDKDIFAHLEKPPAALFTLGAGETIFEMLPTISAEGILAQLPLYAPPAPPSADVCTLEFQEEEWPIPIVPVSKYALGKLVLEEGPPRKKSRYEYDENFDLFANDSDAETSPGEDQSSLEAASKRMRPAPLPPEQSNVALFNPEFKHILNRMSQGHTLKPPNYLPPIGFFETRAPSQWLPSEDEKLKDLVQKYPQNWNLISTFMSFKSEHQSAAERRSPWECFERYLHIENIPPEFTKNPWYKGIQQRLEIAQKATGPYAIPPSNGSGANTPTARRRGNLPYRVERRKNTKYLALFESMRKLAKRRELNQSKQQSAAMRKTENSNQPNKTKLNTNFVPATLSKMKYEREMKAIERQNREMIGGPGQAQKVPHPMRLHTQHPGLVNGGHNSMLQHQLQQRLNVPAAASATSSISATTGHPSLPPGSQLTTGNHRVSPAISHVLPNPSTTAVNASIPGIGVNHGSIQGLNQSAAHGAAAANAVALGLRQNSVGAAAVHRYTPEPVAQIMRLKQQHQLAGQSGIANGIPMNYSQHAIIAAQQQALNAAANAKHATNGNVQQDVGMNGVLSQTSSRQASLAPGHVGSPRIPPVQPPMNHQALQQYLQNQNPNMSPADIQKFVQQRIQEYMRMSAQLAGISNQSGNNGMPNGVNTNGLTAHQQQLYQQQQALRHQQQLLQQRQGSQGPNNMLAHPQPAFGGNGQGGTSLQKTTSMQGQQMQKQASQHSQSPRQAQAQMAPTQPQQQ